MLMNGLRFATIAFVVIAIVAIAHLWLRRRMRWWFKLLWTIILCVPFFGLLFYGFATVSPDPHDDDPSVGPYSAG